MTRKGALKQLLSKSTHNRLKAARFLARNSKKSDLDVLRNALRKEAVSYVRTSLELAIKRASKSISSEGIIALEEIEIPADVRAQLHSKAVEEVTRLLLHEIASPVGLIASAAAREVPAYEHSKTKRHVDSLKRIFEAIEQLKIAAAVPTPNEFDFAEMLSVLVSEVVGSSSVEVRKHGPKPTMITSDPSLLRLAVSNGIRNAVEAVQSSQGNDAHPIIVTWGETDIDIWIAVLDRGPGMVGPAESAFGIGKSTKQGHSGFGLAIARQAIETLGGSCTLQPAMEGGARFEVRWER